MDSKILNALVNKQNIAISGPGGVGKTYQINRIREYCEKENIKYHVCASTGIAAVLIGGSTVHSWAGVKPYMIEKFQKGEYQFTVSWKKESTKRIASTRLLIIDELSMIGKSLFEFIDIMCRKIKKKDEPFGGIQLIVSFDMLQLSPIKDDYVFNSSVWQSLNFSYIYLTKTYRTSDPRFFELLSRARIGKLNKEDIEILKSRVNKENKEFEAQGIKPTILYCHKVNVDKLNFEEIQKLPGSFYNYKSKDMLYKNEIDITPTYTSQPQEVMDYFEESTALINTLVPDEIFLKPQAQVMLTRNLNVEEGLANGSRGVITKCEKEGIFVKFCNKENEILIGYYDFDYTDPITNISFIRKHIPLQLSWALSIHRGQGQTINYAKLDIGKNIFCAGQAYVALSRMSSLEGTVLMSFDPKKVYASDEALDFDEMIREE
jgi:ATP-dependent DNA helicase PIF1